ncbi:MAG: cupredoxin domain-containing protein [Oligoflexia bacterium]|nr:cupredoxin domain-containing protein [Oligoflexia bacterium]
MVDLVGVLLIAFIAWFHWGPRSSFRVASTGGVQDVAITVQGGYSPDLVVVDAGRPVRLRFTRKETSSCTERVVFDDLDLSRLLPTGEEVIIDLPTIEPGEHTFGCQMGMIRGKIVARSQS